MDAQNYVKGLIARINPSRQNDNIAGQHPDLNKYRGWYKGTTAWHYQKVVVKNEISTKRQAASCLGKMGANEWASMFLNEGTTITVPDNKGNDILQDILKKNHVMSKLNNFGEKYFALGYGASVVMPKELNILEETEETFNDVTKQTEKKVTKTIIKGESNGVKISFLDATRTYPITIDEDEVTECAILRFSTNKLTIQVHLLDDNGEYVIGEASGRCIDGSVNADYSTMKVWETHSKTKLFQAWYPVKVDAEHVENQLGTSILTDDVIQWIKAFDTAFEKFIIEYKNGGKRRYVSSELTYLDADGNAACVPLSDEDVYLPSNKMGDSQNMVQEHSSELRADGFVRGLQFFASMVGRGMGLGEDAFTIDQQGNARNQTATAAILKKNGAFRNVKRNENLAEQNLIDMCMAIKEIYNTFVAEGKLTYEVDEVSVRFEDNIIEDTTAKKDQELKEVAAGIRTAAEYRSHWFDEDYDTSVKFVQENAMLLDKYLPALQSGAISPEMYVKLVFGDNVEDKESLVAYITQRMSAPTESNYNDDEDVEQDIESEEDED